MEQIRMLADGRILRADIAKTKGLVDSIDIWIVRLIWPKRSQFGTGQKSSRTPGEGNSSEYLLTVRSSSDWAYRVSLDRYPLFNVLTGGTPQMLYMWMPQSRCCPDVRNVVP